MSYVRLIVYMLLKVGDIVFGVVEVLDKIVDYNGKGGLRIG